MSPVCNECFNCANAENSCESRPNIGCHEAGNKRKRPGSPKCHRCNHYHNQSAKKANARDDILSKSSLKGDPESESISIALDKKKSSEEAIAQECGICFNELGERGVLDSCAHVFCFSCISRWAKRANNCPHCKREISCITRADPAGKIVKGKFPVRSRTLRDTLIREEFARRTASAPGTQAPLHQNINNRAQNNLQNQNPIFSFGQGQSALNFALAENNINNANNGIFNLLPQMIQPFGVGHVTVEQLPNGGQRVHQHISNANNGMVNMNSNISMSTNVPARNANFNIEQMMALRDGLAGVSATVSGLTQNLNNLGLLSSTLGNFGNLTQMNMNPGQLQSNNPPSIIHGNMNMNHPYMFNLGSPFQPQMPAMIGFTNPMCLGFNEALSLMQNLQQNVHQPIASQTSQLQWQINQLHNLLNFPQPNASNPNMHMHTNARRNNNPNINSSQHFQQGSRAPVMMQNNVRFTGSNNNGPNEMR